MAISFKRNDDLEKMMENFAKLPDLEKVTLPDPKADPKKAKKGDK